MVPLKWHVFKNHSLKLLLFGRPDLGERILLWVFFGTNFMWLSVFFSVENLWQFLNFISEFWWPNSFDVNESFYAEFFLLRIQCQWTQFFQKILIFFKFKKSSWLNILYKRFKLKFVLILVKIFSPHHWHM